MGRPRDIADSGAVINTLDGATAGTVVNSKAVVYGSSGEVNATTLQIAGTAITSTAAEINILDGLTATVAELNILDGVTSTTAELNILDGVTSTTAELNILDGVTSTAAELNILDGVTATATELNYVDGVTSAIQTQLNGKLKNPVHKSGNYTASSGDFVVVTAGSITITLPSSPSAGDFVFIKDGTGAAGTTNFTVARNGSNIASSASDLTFDKNFEQILMTYVDSTIGWTV